MQNKKKVFEKEMKYNSFRVLFDITFVYTEYQNLIGVPSPSAIISKPFHTICDLSVLDKTCKNLRKSNSVLNEFAKNMLSRSVANLQSYKCLNTTIKQNRPQSMSQLRKSDQSPRTVSRRAEPENQSSRNKKKPTLSKMDKNTNDIFYSLKKINKRIYRDTHLANLKGSSSAKQIVGDQIIQYLDTRKTNTTLNMKEEQKDKSFFENDHLVNYQLNLDHKQEYDIDDIKKNLFCLNSQNMKVDFKCRKKVMAYIYNHINDLDKLQSAITIKIEEKNKEKEIFNRFRKKLNKLEQLREELEYDKEIVEIKDFTSDCYSKVETIGKKLGLLKRECENRGNYSAYYEKALLLNRMQILLASNKLNTEQASRIKKITIK